MFKDNSANCWHFVAHTGGFEKVLFGFIALKQGHGDYLAYTRTRNNCNQKKNSHFSTNRHQGEEKLKLYQKMKSVTNLIFFCL